MSTRKINVQTPGETSAKPNTDDHDEGTTAQAGTATTTTADDSHDAGADLRARLAALEAENASLRAQAKAGTATTNDAKAVTRGDRAKYLNMHSSEVDAKKLVAPVLCRDGWLAPDKSDQEPRR